ncbi:hypothetical protein [uncultured Thioclava sp.]|uniref:Uncharacterized protein n=1 Tax=Thioclava arctica TaxID=3238301 RepID=A0ABV3TNV1_9RHOB|nr:hypothetical protein [uncultured Thioclava sp.]
MAKTKQKGAGKTADAPAAQRPIRPFFAGVSIASLWGALHVPVFLRVMMIGGFAAKLLAIAIVASGVLMALMEAAVLVGRQLPQLREALSRLP